MGKVLNGKHWNKDWLYQKYIVEKLGIYEIGKLVNKDPKTIWYWLKKYKIPTRPRGHNRDVNLQNGRPKGFKHTPETIEKIKQDTIKKGKVPYLVNGQHWMKDQLPEDNPNWKGGKTPERQRFYNNPEWKQTANQIWRRDNATCQKCGLKYKPKQMEKFHIHHIISFTIQEFRINMDNLILLCRPCHLWVHSKKNINQDFIKEI